MNLSALIAEGRKLRRVGAGGGALTHKVWRKCCPIRNVMDALGINIKELVETSGVPRRTISDVVNGKSLPRPNTFQSICAALTVDPAAMWAQCLEWMAMQPTLDWAEVRRNATHILISINPITKCLKARGMSKAEFAAATGLSPWILQEIMSNPAYNILAEHLLAMASVLNEDHVKLYSLLHRWKTTFCDVPLSEVMGVAILHEGYLNELDSKEAAP